MPYGDWGFRVSTRHGGRTNGLFGDGHAAGSSPGELAARLGFDLGAINLSN